LKKVALSWSSGKDSAWTLHLLRQRPDIQIAALITTFNTEADRVAMHAVCRALVEAQAERTGIPLWAVELHGPVRTWTTRIECAWCASSPRQRGLPPWHLGIFFCKMFEINGFGGYRGAALNRCFRYGKSPQGN
jgi:hypothetical protein